MAKRKRLHLYHVLDSKEFDSMFFKREGKKQVDEGKQD